MKTKMLKVRIEQTQKQELEEASNQLEVSVSHITRQAIRKELAEIKKNSLNIQAKQIETEAA